MRTLKKVLALSMVFAMAFSMMAGAAFNDQDQIDASLVEDIQLLTALEVFQGDEKGDFNPTSNVTRAQAAKMIYVMKNNGQDDQAAAFKGTSVYSDVPSGHWAEGYINYATNLGIMSGWTEGSVRKFDPNGNVTGIELTKMLLCMIGYRADIQGYTGNGWQTNVLRDGATSAITTNYLPTIYNAAPRQWTARLMANAVNAPYVTYSRGEVVMGHATDPSKSYGEQYLGLCTVEGYLRDAGKVSLGKMQIGLDDDGDEIELSATPDLDKEGYKKTSISVGNNINNSEVPTSFKTTVDPSLLGQYVKVYYKAGTLTTMDAKVYSVLPTGQSKVYETTVADVSNGQSKASVAAADNGETLKIPGYNGGSAKTYIGVKLDGNKGADGQQADDNGIYYTPETASNRAIKLVKNLDKVVTVEPLKNNQWGKQNSTTKEYGSVKNFGVFAGNSNEAIRFVDQDGDGYIDLAFTNDVTYAVVNSHNAGRNTIRFENADGGSLRPIKNEVVNSESAYKKLNFVNDVAEGDVVSITKNCSNGTEVWDIAKVEPTTGSVSGYTLDSGNYGTITLNGTSTKFAKNVMKEYTQSATEDTHILNDTTFYTDGKFVVYSKGGTGVASVGNLAYIIGKDKYTSFGKETVFVKVLLSDGTQGQYEVAATYELKNGGVNDKDATLDKTVDPENKVSGGVKYSLIEEDTVMSYSISDNKITLSELKGDYTPNGIKFGEGVQAYDHANKNYKVKTSGTTNYKMSDEAYFFVKSTAEGKDTKYNVVKASELGKNLNWVDSAFVNNTATSYATQNASDGINYVVFGTLNIQGNAVATAAKYAFVKSAANYAVVDGAHVAQMTVVLPDGSEQVIKREETSVTGANNVVKRWNDLRNKVVTYELDSEGNVDGDPKVVDKTTTPTDENWVPVIITGWNSAYANVITNDVRTGDDQFKVEGAPEATLLNVASDVKVHVVDTSETNYSLTDGSVERTAKNDANDKYVGYSAFIHVQNVNGQLTITDIYSGDGGSAVTKLF